MFDKLSIAILRIAASFVFLMLLVACIVEDYALNRDPTLTNCSLQAEVISGSVKNDKNRAVACGDECFQYLARCLPGGVQYARSSRYNPHASFLSVFLASQYPNGHAIVFSIIAFYAILAALGTDIENRQLKWLAYWPHAVVLYFLQYPLDWIADQARFTHLNDHYGHEDNFGAFLICWALAPYLGVYFDRFLMGFPALVAWYHYLFVGHPAAPVVLPALRTGSPIEKMRFAATLKPNPREFESLPSIVASANQTAKAQALAEKLKADADLARAATEREKARAALRDAKRQLKVAEQRAKGK